MALKLPELDPQECLDYSVEFSDLLAAGRSIIDATVVLESVAPEVSPMPDLQYGSPSVFLTNTQPQPSPQPSPLRNDTVVFWLSGTNIVVGSTYTFKVLALDDNTPQRCYLRRVAVKGKLK
ncbi:MAG: hypothetical protein OEQ39_12590 [Gammaproteobacteria bacterium]|nr:hypothetical protein [Gammaproteobacteria bacterium]